MNKTPLRHTLCKQLAATFAGEDAAKKFVERLEQEHRGSKLLEDLEFTVQGGDRYDHYTPYGYRIRISRRSSGWGGGWFTTYTNNIIKEFTS